MKKPLSYLSTILFFICLILGNSGIAQDINNAIDPSVIKGFKLRNITPSHSGGRIADIAIDQNNTSVWYAAASSGNVWKTNNAGTTWNPIFDTYGSYSIGIVVIDPNDSNVIWLGTGENNAQRSVSKGDGVYKSLDGGNTWKNMGLKTSEHIGKIIIDPRNSDVIYVAAVGSVWASGGERGLYKTTDGGLNWDSVLQVSETTGISDIVFDPRNPDVLLVSSYQRRRHPGVLVAGGPDGGIWKTEDAGKNWSKLKNGLPGGDLGRIGLAISPQRPDVCYALIAGTADTKGFYRSSNLGENWKKMSDYMNIDAQYYMELFPDPHQFDKVYSVNTLTQVTEDGGKTFKNMNNRQIHVDHHEIVFDPDDPNHMWIGNDGGIYQTWDGTKTWQFFDNMPITQFYRVGIDNDYPFYNVYGGTQDNATIGGPSRTISREGIHEGDWFVTTGGDGFQTRVDPDNPNIVYSESQYGYLVRYDKQSKEQLRIQPQPGPGEAPYRWHWNAPLLISPHNPQRLYFASERVFRSNDRGNSWKEISEDLSLNRDRNKLEVMDRVWGIDAVFKNVWTSPMGTIVSLDESPIKEGLMYAGTDDGQISVTTTAGESWRKIRPIKGVPENTFVADIHTSRTDANTVFVIFNNHKFGDYKPYVFKSEDAGESWSSIKGNLPDGEYLWSIQQDHENAELLFLGAEYGLYFSIDGGKNWNKFNAGIPTIAIRDLEIQKRESDLVTASFGRGFYILDDYSPLRTLSPEILNKDVHLFPIKDALQYTEARPRGGALGNNYVTSSNPAYGANFTYHLKESRPSLKQIRKKSESQKVKDKEPVYYPDWKDLANERREDKPTVLISIYDLNGQKISSIYGPASKGIHRISWNLRNSLGVKVKQGTYNANISTIVNGKWEESGSHSSFNISNLENSTMPAADFASRQAFYNKAQDLSSKVRKANRILDDLLTRINAAGDLAISSIALEKVVYEKLKDMEGQIYQFKERITGNRLMTEKMELIPPSINSRLGNVRSGLNGFAEVSETHKSDYEIAAQEYQKLIVDYSLFIENDLKPMVSRLNADSGTISIAFELLPVF